LIVENGGFFKVVSFAAPDGERYPHLVRTAGPDVLEAIYHPRTFVPPIEKVGG
jgi:hypothetical protein